MIKAINPPIRSFGGKSGMIKKMLSFCPDISSYSTYIEAFAGSAALLFAKEKSPIEICNDLNKNIYSLYKVISDKNLMLE
ncbi:MAG: DNA adenine methylase, partial [Nanoarchaeota archaeon]